MPKFKLSETTSAVCLGGNEYSVEDGVLDLPDAHGVAIADAHRLGYTLHEEPEPEKKNGGAKKSFTDKSEA